MVHFGEFLKIWSLRSNSVTRQVSFNRTKIGGKCQNSNGTFWVHFSTFQQNSGEMRHLRYFLNTVLLKLILEGKQLQKTDRNELHTIFNFKCCFIFRRHTKKINVPHFEVKKYDLNLSRLQLGSLKKEDDEKEVENQLGDQTIIPN